MEQQIEIIVEEKDDGTRVDAYLREHTTFSRSRVSALIQEGALRIDGCMENKPSRKLASGEKLTLMEMCGICIVVGGVYLAKRQYN